MSPVNVPFFIVGAQRSGTTMLRLMLNRNSRLCVPFESVFIPAFFHRLEEFGDLSCHSNLERLLDGIADDPWVVKGNLMPDRNAVLARDAKDYPGLIDAIFAALAARQGKCRWGDKTPGYVIDIDILWTLFPGCRIIHLVRDGRDVALSLRNVSWGSRNILKTAADWRWKVMLGRKMGRMIPDNYLEVHYEDLVSDPVTSLQRICAFIGDTDFEPGMLHYHETAGSEMPASSLRWHASSISAPDTGKVQQWQQHLSVEDQVLFEEVAGDALALFGYKRVSYRPTLGTRWRRTRYALLGHA